MVDLFNDILQGVVCFPLQIETNGTGGFILEFHLDVVSVGDPLLRYDATRAQLSYGQNKLDLVKLENKLRASYAEYRKYAREDYEHPLLTPTPRPTARARHSSAGSRAAGISRLSMRYAPDLITPIDGDGSALNPFLYEIGAEDPVPSSFLQPFFDLAAEREEAVYVRIAQPEAEILLTVLPDATFELSVHVEDDTASADFEIPERGNGTVK